MNSNTISQKLTFLELIKNYKIEIPIIQRDYAQGREDKHELRRDFLQTLRSAIVEDKSLELDFVYGDVKEGFLRPLDGQQRLTTLFLLHWYIANKESNVSLSDKEQLLKFTYETRASSREFCEELVKGNIDFNNLLSTDYHDKDKTLAKNNQLSKTLENSSWFFMSWRRDPTIKAMLTMLDSVHQIFDSEINLWSNLDNISFHFIELKGFGLSDDLYIKMNARGKPLTVFENFKAKFEKHIQLKSWEEGLHVTETFAHKIDTIWTDLFWKHKGEDLKVDDNLLKFIANIAILLYAQNHEIYSDDREEKMMREQLEGKGKGKNITHEAVKTERIEKRIAELSNNFTFVKPNDFPTKIAFDYLKQVLDLYSNKNSSYDLLVPAISFWDHLKTTETLFLKVINSKESTSYHNRVLFYAQTVYLLSTHEGLSNESLNDWMRVMRNIIENTAVDSGTITSMIGLVRELSVGQSDIYGSLSSGVVQSMFSQEQVKEEVEKARIITRFPDIKLVLQDIEDTSFCKGRISFALYCVDYDLDYPDLEILDKQKVKQIYQVIQTCFENDDEYELYVRAFLTIRGNDFYHGWWHWSFSFGCHKGYFYGQTQMKTGKGAGYSGYSVLKGRQRDYLKEFFLKLIDKKSFRQVIDDYVIPEDMPNWTKRLIKEDNLLNGASFILVPPDNSYCKLARQQKPSREDQVVKIE